MFGGGFEGFTDASTDGKKQAELMLFYADWCPACKAFKPAWHETKEAADQKTIGGYHVIFTDVNCSNKDDSAVTQKCKQFGVSGYPTVVLLKDGQKTTFSGKRTKEGLMSFLQANLS
jgi:protein disulfide-isomerase A1